MNDIENLREKIDEVDAEILRLLNQRTELVLQIGEVKSQKNDNVYVPHREKAIIERLKNLNTGHFPNDALEATYREILSASRALEKPISVAHLGPEGSFGHAASIKHFGSSTNYIPIQPQTDIFIEVESGRADYGVVAIENSIDGGIRDTQDMFMESNVQICAEIMMPVFHNLLSNSPAEKIKKIYSHPQPFAQCRNWLKNNFKETEQIAVSSTSEAAMIAALGKRLSMLFVLVVIGCVAVKSPPSTAVSETGSTASTPSMSMDERARIFFNVIAEGQTTIDQGTFLNYYRRQATGLARSGRVKMGKDEIAQSGTQLFRKLDRNHDSKITEEEIKFALQARARERQKLRRANPQEWNLLDDAF